MIGFKLLSLFADQNGISGSTWSEPAFLQRWVAKDLIKIEKYLFDAKIVAGDQLRLVA